MKFFDLLVLIGVDPNIRPAIAIAWFIAAMAAAAILMFSGLLLAADTGNDLWMPIMTVVALVSVYLSGKIFGILDDGKRRSGIRDLGKFITTMLSHGWDTKQPIGKIIAWALGGMLAFLGLSHFLTQKMIETGETGWFFLIFPAGFVIIVIVRHFGPTK